MTRISLDLIVTLNASYPRAAPKVDFGNVKGLGDKEVAELRDLLHAIATKCLGEVMIHELASAAETYLEDHNKKPLTLHESMEARQQEQAAALQRLKQEFLVLDESETSPPKPARDAVASVAAPAASKASQAMSPAPEAPRPIGYARERGISDLSEIGGGDADFYTTYLRRDSGPLYSDSLDIGGELLSSDDDDGIDAQGNSQPASAETSRYKLEFREQELLGRGASGEVWKVINRLDKRIYAVKKIILDSSDAELNRKIRREVTTISRLLHNHIVRYYAAWYETTTLVRGDGDGDGDDGSESGSEEGSSTSTSDSSGSKEISEDSNRGKEQPGILSISKPRLMLPGEEFESDFSASSSSSEASSEDSSSDDSSRTSSSGSSVANSDSDSDSSSSSASSDEADEEEEQEDEPQDNFDIIFEDGSDNPYGTLFSAANSMSHRDLSSKKHKPKSKSKSSRKGIQEKENGEDSQTSASTIDRTNVGKRASRPASVEVKSLFLQMEYCETTLRALIDGGRLWQSTNEIYRLLRQIISALAYVHGKGVIHRDLKVAQYAFSCMYSFPQIHSQCFFSVLSSSLRIFSSITRVISNWAISDSPRLPPASLPLNKTSPLLMMIQILVVQNWMYL
jgi:hypothetical protein